MRPVVVLAQTKCQNVCSHFSCTPEQAISCLPSFPRRPICVFIRLAGWDRSRGIPPRGAPRMPRQRHYAHAASASSRRLAAVAAEQAQQRGWQPRRMDTSGLAAPYSVHRHYPLYCVTLQYPPALESHQILYLDLRSRLVYSVATSVIPPTDTF